MLSSNAKKWIPTPAGLSLLLLLGSCTTGPDYQRPAMNTPDTYKSAVSSEAGQPGLARDWWRLFNDDELNALADEALEANLNLKAAVARVEQSRAAAQSVRSSFFPVITLDPSATRSRTPGANSSSTSSSDASSDLSSLLSRATEGGSR